MCRIRAFVYCFHCALTSHAIISTGKSVGMSSIDELEDFAMGTMRRSASASDTASKYREAEDAATKNKQFGVDDLDSFFSARSSSVPKSRTTTEVRRL